MLDKHTILIAGMGTSPAVLTETVWALCHQKKPMVPDEIVVLVTKSGKEKLCEELLTGEESVWDQMLAALKKEKIKIDGKLIFGETSIRVIPDERGNGAWDLRSGEDNLRAADFMLRQIRQYTESSDTVVLASIAGGRKTMSALLFSCMSLLGREDDKVFHVLLPSEFEGGVEPPMYYPVKGVTYTNVRTGKKYKSDKYHSELFEVPFVRMRAHPGVCRREGQGVRRRVHAAGGRSRDAGDVPRAGRRRLDGMGVLERRPEEGRARRARRPCADGRPGARRVSADRRRRTSRSVRRAVRAAGGGAPAGPTSSLTSAFCWTDRRELPCQ